MEVEKNVKINNPRNGKKIELFANGASRILMKRDHIKRTELALNCLKNNHA